MNQGLIFYAAFTDCRGSAILDLHHVSDAFLKEEGTITMAYQFTKDLETGNRTIDSQHQQLIAAVNALLDACSKGAARHKQLHEEFKKSATVLIQQIQQEGPNVATVGQINTLLAGWLIQHIKGEDKKLAAYLKSMS